MWQGQGSVVFFNKYTHSSGRFTLIFIPTSRTESQDLLSSFAFYTQCCFPSMGPCREPDLWNRHKKTQFGLAKQTKGANRQMGYRKSGSYASSPRLRTEIRYPVSPAESRHAPQQPSKFQRRWEESFAFRSANGSHTDVHSWVHVNSAPLYRMLCCGFTPNNFMRKYSQWALRSADFYTPGGFICRCVWMPRPTDGKVHRKMLIKKWAFRQLVRVLNRKKGALFGRSLFFLTKNCDAF